MKNEKETGAPLSNEQYRFNEIQEEAYFLWRVRGGNPQEAWEIAKVRVIKRPWQPKAITVVDVTA